VLGQTGQETISECLSIYKNKSVPITNITPSIKHPGNQHNVGVFNQVKSTSIFCE
jgi:hypothetical protein